MILATIFSSQDPTKPMRKITDSSMGGEMSGYSKPTSPDLVSTRYACYISYCFPPYKLVFRFNQKNRKACQLCRFQKGGNIYLGNCSDDIHSFI